jgi:hypothetical protein
MNAKQCRIALVGILLLSLVNTLSPVCAGPPLHVGNIEASPTVGSETKASECFSLFREGKKVKVHWDMPVNVGDEILPHKEKCVLLFYIKTGFNKLEINDKTIVRLPEEITLTTRGNKEEIELLSKGCDEDRPKCFPLAPLCLSPLPEKGSTLLAGEAILFRWYSSRVPSCEKVRLVIASLDKSKPSIEEDMQAGELKIVNAKLQAGKKYEWFVKYEDNKESEKYAFSVLDEETSKDIRRQLDNISKVYKDSSPMLYQALYLQFISDINEGLNLYADSLRLSQAYLNQIDKAFKLIENLQKHYDSGQ